MSHRLHLYGCTPTPLAAYLKALGVLRLVAEQLDPEAMGYWEGEHFVLQSALDQDRLNRFLLVEYHPTPVLAPWNSNSGFYPKDTQTGIVPLGLTGAERFREFRDTIRLIGAIIANACLLESPDQAAKARLLTRLRAELPDHALPWLDAAVLVTGDAPKYPPLLGTGGNDGRFDFTNNFMQRLCDLFDMTEGRPSADAPALLEASLWAEATPGLPKKAVGQFFPGKAGGPNAGLGFTADSRVNPWDFVLALEGSVLFASAATRRFERVGPGVLAYPFTVHTTGSGSGAQAPGDETNARAELWLPLWRAPTPLTELRAFLAEGRATVKRKPARDGLGFARAVATLGVARGIDEFERFGFLMRSGKAYLATPLGRVPVRRTPYANLLDELDGHGYLDRLRRFARQKDAPGRVRLRVHRLENALFACLRRPGKRSIQELLALLGELEIAVCSSPKARDAVPPAPTLSAEWALAADDGSSEFRIAAAWAGLRSAGLPMRSHLAPLASHGSSWTESSRDVVWGPGSVTDNLLRVTRRRLLRAAQLGGTAEPFDGRPQVDTMAVVEFLAGDIDDVRAARLVAGLAMVRLPDRFPPRKQLERPIPAALAVLEPFWRTDGLLRFLGLLSADRSLPLPTKLPTLLAAQRVEEAVSAAWRRARAAGLTLPRHPRSAPSASGLDGHRLLAALAAPLAPADLGNLARGVMSARSTG